MKHYTIQLNLLELDGVKYIRINDLAVLLGILPDVPPPPPPPSILPDVPPTPHK